MTSLRVGESVPIRQPSSTVLSNRYRFSHKMVYRVDKNTLGILPICGQRVKLRPIMKSIHRRAMTSKGVKYLNASGTLQMKMHGSHNRRKSISEEMGNRHPGKILSLYSSCNTHVWMARMGTREMLTKKQDAINT